MKQFVYSALALTLAGVPAMAADSGWSGLDQQIDSLSASLTSYQGGSGGPKIGGFVMTSYRNSGDVSVGFDLDGDGTDDGANDLGGFQLDNVRVELTGDCGEDYSYKVSFDIASGTLETKDAYIKWKIIDQVSGKAGRFKMPILRSGLISENRLLFFDRTLLGSLFGGRDTGAQVFGTFDMISWWVTVQNGLDGQGDELKLGGRLEANLMGTGVAMQEGALGANEENNLTIGVGASDDGVLDNGTAVAADVYFTAGPFSVTAEIADLDEDIGDATPWDVTGSYLFIANYEGAVRYQDFDDADNTTMLSIGVNRYVKGHDIKWHLSWSTIDSDDSANEADLITLGLAASM
jgi:hypothetical protein